MIFNHEDKIHVERDVKKTIFIEKVGNINIKTFNNKFNSLQLEIINLMKQDSRCCTDYAYLYLKYLEKMGIIKFNINIQDNKIISPESVDRIKRKLFEHATNGNNQLSFLLKYKQDNNEILFNESKKFYRNN